MPYEPKNFDHLLGAEGFSDALLQDHFALYRGYVNNVNKLTDILAEMRSAGKLGTPEYAELNRRFGWEFNGMRLHEYYFGNMTKEKSEADPQSALPKKLAQDFGSREAWEKDFRALAGMRGIGWIVLYYDTKADRLLNVWINEHDAGHLAGAEPLLVLDVFEHAYIRDYGLKRAEYVEAFFRTIDWKAVSDRLRK